MESIKYFNTTLENIQIDSRELYILMGYGDHTPSEYILSMIDEMLIYLKSCCKPRLGYMICDGKRINKEFVEVQQTLLHTGAIIATAMKEAESIAIFTVTLGKEFDKWMHTLRSEDDIVNEFVANTLGSVLAEALVEQLVEQLEEDVTKNDLLISNNYSPGYCDWRLDEQKKIFAILPPLITGIELTDSCLMLPIKSVSGIIAVGKNVKKRPYKCAVCSMKTCVRNLKKAN